MKKILEFMIIIIHFMVLIIACNESPTNPQEVNMEIHVVYPNGGEIVRGGDTVVVEWSSSTNLYPYNVYYKNETGSWNLIQSDIADTFATWVVPITNLENTEVKVDQIDNNSIKNSDTSDSTFSIINQYLEIKKPNANTIISDTLTIEWNVIGIDQIDIFYSIDGGNTLILIEGSYDASKKHFNWVPQSISSSEVIVSISYISRINNSINFVVSELFQIISEDDIMAALSFFPLHINDTWVYKVDATLMAPTYYPDLTWEQRKFTYFLKCELVDSTDNNGITMYKPQHSIFLPDTTHKDYHALYQHPMLFSWIGVDSRTASVQPYPEFNLLMELGDSIDLRYTTNYYGSISVIDVGNENIFDSNRDFKTYKTTHAYFGTTYKYVSGIGIMHGNVWEEYRKGEFMLKGCIINNIVYGDTSTVF